MDYPEDPSPIRWRMAALESNLHSALHSPDRPLNPPPIPPLDPLELHHFATHLLSPEHSHYPTSEILDLLSLILVPSEWPTPGFPSLRRAAGPAATTGVCGKVWKQDELAYKCKTCERDPTCVVCVRCFRNGDHAGHDFAMVRTSGGCCDCGDVQAWRPEGFCVHHRGACPEDADPGEGLPPLLRRNLIIVVRAVAISVLGICFSAQKDLQYRFVAHGVRLVDWLKDIVQIGDGIRRVVGLLLTEPALQWPTEPSSPLRPIPALPTTPDSARFSWLTLMLEIDGAEKLPAPLQKSIHAVYFQLITDLVFKRAFLDKFVHNYERYIHAQLQSKLREQEEPSHERSQVVDIVEDFTVQLFTVPALVPVMLRRGGLLDILINLLLRLFEATAVPITLYSKGVPFAQSAFANEFQSRRARTASDSGASSSTSPPPPSNSFTLPIPFPSKDLATNTIAKDPHSGFLNRRRGLSQLIVRGDPAAIDVRIMMRSAPRLGESAQEQRPLRRDDSTPSPATPMEAIVRTSDDARDTREQFATPVMAAAGLAITLSPPVGEIANRIADDNEDVGVADEGEAGTERIEFDVEGTVELGNATGDGTVLPGRTVIGMDVEQLNMLTHQPPDEDDPMEDIESGREHVESADDSERNMREQLAVFEDSLNIVAMRKNRLSSTERKQSRLVAAVNEARRMEEAAYAGTGPLAHTMRLGWPPRQRKISDFVCWRVVNDLKYVLTHQLVAFHLVHVRQDLFRKFVRIMSIAQGMNWCSRRFKHHVPREGDTWAESFTIEIEFFYYVELLAAAFCGPKPSSKEADLFELEEAAEEVDLPSSRLRCISIVRSCLDEWLDREELLEARSIYTGETFNAAHAVSVHLPLHRFLAFLVHHVLRLDGVSLSMALSGGNCAKNSAESVKSLMKHPLRVQAFLSQVRAGMWRRNGHPVEGQSMFYSSVLCSEWFVDLDLFLQQCCAAVIGPDSFLKEVLKGFRIDNFAAVARLPNSYLQEGESAKYEDPRRIFIWRRLTREGEGGGSGVASSSATTRWPEQIQSVKELGFLPLAPRRYAERSLFYFPTITDGGNSGSELAGFTPTLIEDMVVYIVRVAAERCRCGAGEAEVLRRKLLHQLSSRDRTHSQLYRACSYRICNELNKTDLSGDSSDEVGKSDSLVEETLAAIADYVEPRGMEQGRYKLKDELWEEFDPFTPHIVPRERCAAEVRHAAVCRRLKKKMQVIPSEVVSERTILPQLRGLEDLFVSVSQPGATATEMLRTALPQHGGPNSIEGAISAALHLVCAAVESRPNAKSSSYWLNVSLQNGNFGDTAVGVVCEMFNLAERQGSALYSEFTPVLERILVQAYRRGNDNVKQDLAGKVPNAVLRDSTSGLAVEASGSAALSPEQERRKALLRKKKEQQAAAMARMRLAQASFAKHIDENDSAVQIPRATPDKKGDEVCSGEIANRIQPAETVSKVDTRQGPSASREHMTEECALCREIGSGDDTPLMGLIGFHQSTRLPAISRDRCREPIPHRLQISSSFRLSEDRVDSDILNLRNSFTVDSTGNSTPVVQDDGGNDAMEDATSPQQSLHQIDSFFLNADMLKNGVEGSKNLHLSFCGHAIHIHCFERYFSSLLRSRANETVFEGYNVLNLDRLEFLCPVCRRLANMVLPLMYEVNIPSTLNATEQNKSDVEELSYEDWISWYNMEITDDRNRGGTAQHMNSAKSPNNSMILSSPSEEHSTTVNGLRSKIIVRGRAVLQRFRLQSFNSPQNVRGSESIEVVPELSSVGSYTKLPSAAISTVACAEIAARSESWGGPSSHITRKSLGTVLREARSQIKLEVEPRRLGLFKLLKAVRSRRTESQVDPFAALAFLFLLWHEPLTFFEVKYLVRLCYDLMRMQHSSTEGNSLLPRTKWDSRSLLFLRRAAILVSSYFETTDSPPLVVYRADGSDSSPDEVRREIEGLRKYFDIPEPMDATTALAISALETTQYGPLSLDFKPRRVGLIKLPRLFQSLLEGLDGKLCSACSRTPKGAALCLVCGDLVCSNSKSCKSRRLPNIITHANDCGAGIGVFLVLKITCVQIFRKDRTTIWGSPYLDAHGEEDKKFIRGKPLFLNNDRYASLERLWLTHGFDFDSRILGNTVLNRMLHFIE